MANLTISGTLMAAPTSSSDSTFPSGSSSSPLLFNPNPKPAPVNCGFQQRSINSSGAYSALSGVGASDTVTQANFLYLRTKVPMLVRLTTNNPAGGSVVIAGIPVNGLLVLEFDAARYLTLLEIQGSGIVEYFVSGNL